jgi:hypothetical protein
MGVKTIGVSANEAVTFSCNAMPRKARFAFICHQTGDAKNLGNLISFSTLAPPSVQQNQSKSIGTAHKHTNCTKAGVRSADCSVNGI